MKHAALNFATLISLALGSAGCGPTKAPVKDPTDLHAYIENANKVKAESNKSEGSLWTGNGYHSNLFRDPKARYIDDVVTINVSEATQALATADAKSSKNSSLNAGFPNLLGLEKRINELPTLISGTSASSFEGTGTTTRQTTLQTSLTARVIGVLPNGYLVVEGMREIRVDNESQTVYLNGVIRPEDISPNNTIPSSSVAQMSVRVQGKGFVSQPMKQGWLFKILNGILPF